MRRRFPAVLSVTLGLTTAVTLALDLGTEKSAYAQSGTCPEEWASSGVTNCVTMPPPYNDSITTTIQPNGTWSSAFNSSDGFCVTFYNNFQSAYASGRVVIADMPAYVWGMYTGNGYQDGTIGIASATFQQGNNLFVASVAIHESAHDFGCTDADNLAQRWADYCVPVDPQNLPPPPPPCPNM